MLTAVGFLAVFHGLRCGFAVVGVESNGCENERGDEVDGDCEIREGTGCEGEIEDSFAMPSSLDRVPFRLRGASVSFSYGRLSTMMADQRACVLEQLGAMEPSEGLNDSQSVS